MAGTTTSNVFENALTNLEILADVRSSLYPGEAERNEFNDLIKSEVIAMLDAMQDQAVSNKPLQYLQRVTAIRVKLYMYRDSNDTISLDDLVIKLMSATTAASTKARMDKTSSVQQQKDHKFPLILERDVEEKSFMFTLRSGGSHQARYFNFFDYTTVALSTSRNNDSYYVRLIPVGEGGKIQMHIHDIKLANAEDAKVVTDHLLKMNVTLFCFPRRCKDNTGRDGRSLALVPLPPASRPMLVLYANVSIHFIRQVSSKATSE
ncbi:MAG: hypothetical protein Q9188_003901 [Gyalolechia gomerana]